MVDLGGGGVTIHFYINLIEKFLISLPLSCLMLYNEITKSFFLVKKLNKVLNLIM